LVLQCGQGINLPSNLGLLEVLSSSEVFGIRYPIISSLIIEPGFMIQNKKAGYVQR
jgi:hypothetical protein